MSDKFKDLSLITIFTLALTLLMWLPHFLALPNFWGLNFSQGFSTIYKNFDGLEYIVIAKTWYDPSEGIYFASHFPGYSMLIAIFAPLLGYLKSMLFVSLSFTIASAVAFYFLVRDFKLSSRPLFLSLIFLILPARWLIVHSVGSSEPIFIFFIIMAVYFFMKYEEMQKFNFIFLSGLFGLFAQIVRPPGILLFIALSVYLFWKIIKAKFHFKTIIQIKIAYFPLMLIPLGLLAVFGWYQISYGDFWAYFKSGDNIHLFFPPFQVFNKEQFWVGDIWLEDIVYIFILGFLAGILLLKQKLYPAALFVLTYLTASLFVAHRDIARYILPATPFVLITFEKILTSREFKIILPIILIAIYLYAQNFILANVAPIPNLSIYN